MLLTCSLMYSEDIGRLNTVNLVLQEPSLTRKLRDTGIISA